MTNKKRLISDLALPCLVLFTIAVVANCAWANKGPAISADEKLREQNAEAMARAALQKTTPPSQEQPAPPPAPPAEVEGSPVEGGPLPP